MVKSTNKAYSAGKKAYHQGKRESLNPYIPHSQEWFDWIEGWKDKMEESNQNGIQECIEKLLKNSPVFFLE